MRRKYCCDASSGTYEDYYVNQAGSGLPIFQGSRGQRGHGVGSVLGGLFRSALPMLKRVGSQALRTGARIASDMASGKKFSDVALQRISEGISSLADPESVTLQTGTGRARRRRFVAAKKRKRAYKRKTSKRRRGDIFD
jgi:hypothetical protein